MRPPDELPTDPRGRVRLPALRRIDDLARRADRPPAVEPEPGGVALECAGGLTLSRPAPRRFWAQITSGPSVVPDPHDGFGKRVWYAFRTLTSPIDDDPRSWLVREDGVAEPGTQAPGAPMPTASSFRSAYEANGNDGVPMGAVVEIVLSDNGHSWEFCYPVPGGPDGPVAPPTNGGAGGPPEPGFYGYLPPGTVQRDPATGALWLQAPGYPAYGLPPMLTGDGSDLAVSITNNLSWDFSTFGLTISAAPLTVNNLAVTTAAALPGGTTIGGGAPLTTAGLTAGRVPYASGASVLADSPIYVSGSSVGVGAAPSTSFGLDVVADIRSATGVYWFGAGASPAVKMWTPSNDWRVVHQTATGCLISLNDTNKWFEIDDAAHDMAFRCNGSTGATGAVSGLSFVGGIYTSGTLGALNTLPAPTGDLSMGSHKLTNVTDPTAAQDAATKNYVDAATNGLDWKASVRAATTAAGTLATSFENGDTIDGVTLATGNRILLKNQASAAENGIYTVNASGAPTRATDADSSAEVTTGLAVFVGEGTANGGTAWILTTADPVTLGSTALVFTQFGSPGAYTAGTGLSLTGLQFAVSDAELLALAGLTSAADRLPYFTGPGTAALATFTAAGRALIDDADAAAQRATLGLGTAAVKDTGTSGATVPLLNGVNTWADVNTFPNNGIYWKDSDGSHTNHFNFASNLTAHRELLVRTGDADVDLTLSGTCSLSGTNTGDQTVPAAAAQSDQETATSTTTYVPPGRQQYHPSACKGWVYFTPGNPPTVQASYNVTSVSRTAAGDYTVNWNVDMSSGNYCALALGANIALLVSIAAGTTRVQFYTSAFVLSDAGTLAMVAVFGDQA